MTPEQYNLIASKDDLNRVEQKVDTLDEKFDQMITLMEGIATNVKIVQEEQVANIAAHDRFETRITKVEKHLELKPNY